MKSVLDVACSAFNNSKDTTAKTVNLLKFLTSEKFVNRQEKVRTAKTEDEKQAAKMSIPCITPSGSFSKRGKGSLVNHTGLLAIDIDAKGNENIKNFNELGKELANLSEVAYCGRSVSGQGWWAIVPIAHPERHEEHFEFVKLYFKSLGIAIDGACRDVSRLRFYSYDPSAYFNHSALPLTKYYTAPQPTLKAKSVLSSASILKSYNRTENFIDALSDAGWTAFEREGAKIFFTRPGKDSGISAEYDSTKGEGSFYVFTSSEEAAPFEADTSYSPAAVYTLLKFGGLDKKHFAAAAKQLEQELDFEELVKAAEEGEQTAT